MQGSVRNFVRTFRFSIALVAIGAMGLPAGNVVAATMSAPMTAQPPLETLSSTVMPVTSSTNVKLNLGVSASNSSTVPGDAAVRISSSTPGMAPYEYYTWTFNEPAAAFVVGANGNATVTLTPKQISPYGSVTLAFKSGSAKAEACSKGSGTIESGSLTGSLTLNTNSYRTVNGKKVPIWGVVKQKVINFVAKGYTNFLTIDRNCVPVTPPPTTPACTASLSWASPSFIFYGYTALGAKSGTLTAFTSSVLKVPEGSASLSGLFTDVTPPQTFVSNKLAVKTGYPGEKATFGSASMTYSGPTVKATTSSCKSGSTTKQESTRNYLGSFTWTNGPKPLTLAFTIAGTIQQANVTKGYGTLTVSTFK